jgi:hypothetical protein
MPFSKSLDPCIYAAHMIGLCRYAYSLLMQNLPQSGHKSLSSLDSIPKCQGPKSSDFTAEQLQRMFWHKTTWNKHVNETEVEKGKRGRGRAAEGINVNMLYIVDRDGRAVDGFVSTQIRKVARDFWKGLSNAGKAPDKWMTDVDLATSEQFHHEMQSRFDVLCLCDAAWKVDQIAIDFYPAWRTGKVRSGTLNISEKENAAVEISDDEDAGTSDKPRNRFSPGKRKPMLAQALPAKKQKTECGGPSARDKSNGKVRGSLCMCPYIDSILFNHRRRHAKS